MITKEKIQFLVSQVLSDDMFIVDITVGSGNAISVSIDSDAGVTIDDCIATSRHIEQNLDRETDDFSLEVSSPGLTQPFKILRQYKKNIGQKIEVVAVTGEKKEGILISADEQGFQLEIASKEKVNGTKAMVMKTIDYTFEQVKTVKLVISFK